MPWPYVAAHTLLVVLTVAAAWACARKRPRVGRGLVIGTVLVLLPLQLLVVKFPWLLANATGWSDVVFFAELYPELAALTGTAALLAQESRAARVRTGLLTAALAATAWVASSPTGAHPGEFPRPWVDSGGVVRQTRPSSCAAAAAATLLRAEGIAPQASEAELAALCLTDPQQGTRDLGLFRGLALSAPGRTVRFSFPDLDALRTRGGAAVIFVGLSDSRADPELYRVLRDECGWAEGVVHAVVCYGLEPGRPGEDVEVVLIGDPRYGYERWGITHFKALWTGQALGFE